MAGDAGESEARYWAFISYSHRDAGFGRKIHRRLENYVLPARLVGQETRQGKVPRRLAPIFRDRDELPAAHNLTTEVRAALKASRSLVVICTPTAAQSTWVAREIELFRELHPDRPILAALVKGEPEESFPDALRQAGADGAIIEPLAADFRADGDGTRPALLKLVAGIIGIGLDQLVQRDAQRNLRRVMAVTVTAITIAVLMGLLTIFAFTAQFEAERQRTEAQGLVGFMITDLRYKLKGVGRLDIMSAVNERALQYYDRQDHLSEDMQARRAQVLLALGEDDANRGNYNAAMTRFDDAFKTTSALLDKHPSDPERIFDHAQSEFWVGSVAYDKGHYSAAMPAFQAYKRLTDKLVALVPDNPKYQKEAGFAEGNLCSLAVRERSNGAEALRACSAALAHIEHAADKLGPTGDMQDALANRHAWLADAYRINGNLPRARDERLIEEAILLQRMKADSLSMDIKDSWVSHQMAFASLDKAVGQFDDARKRLLQAKSILDSMTKFDPNNHSWSRKQAFIEEGLKTIPAKSH